MLLNIAIAEKSFANRLLHQDLQFSVQAGEKVGLIGRNGTGKSTLFNMITGDDNDYQGDIERKRDIVIINSRQEHHGLDDTTVLDYIQGDLPEFSKLHHILETYPAHMGESPARMQAYSDALERFSQLGYYEVEDHINQALELYQLDPSVINRPLKTLSGGQKRLVELIKVQRARGDLALIDEPTNHMDYVAKQAFVTWLQNAQEAVLVITHDRDVLNEVDRIVEIRDYRAYSFAGNYSQYLKANRHHVTSQVNEYDLTQRRIANLKDDVIRFRRLKERSRDPGTIKRFKGQEERAAKELAELSKTEKPSFWIDRDQAEAMTPKMAGAYQKYKTRNIALTTKTEASRSSRLLIEARDLTLSYGNEPLFQAINFSLREGERLRLHGRNGAGKTTLVKAIMAAVEGNQTSAKRLTGTLLSEKDLRLGLYEQEIDSKYLPMTLSAAIETSFIEKDVPISDQKIKQLLSQYLFNPATDGDMPVEKLSGGQKARFQLMRMLCDDPIVLILDEPTNHLDLPSIEELENALADYKGAVIYISHDSYFVKNIGGEVVTLKSPDIT